MVDWKTFSLVSRKFLGVRNIVLYSVQDTLVVMGIGYYNLAGITKLEIIIAQFG